MENMIFNLNLMAIIGGIVAVVGCSLLGYIMVKDIYEEIA